ncbi:MAG: hypothetical protein ACM359_22520, partial [Bacillota bacterium]
TQMHSVRWGNMDGSGEVQAVPAGGLQGPWGIAVVDVPEPGWVGVMVGVWWGMRRLRQKSQ